MMSGLLPPRSSKDVGRCLTLPAAVRRLIVVIDVICSSVWRAMSVTRTPGALVLDVESCNQLAGCPGCGVIAQGHGRMVVEVIDAPWAGVPVRIRWHNTAMDMPRTHLPDGDIPGT